MTAGGTLPIGGITLEGFRGFERFEVADLSRLSLVVGGPRGGKASILEGIELLASPVGPQTLIRLARRRGHEPVALGEGGAGPGQEWGARGYDIGPFFRGGVPQAGSSFRIAAGGGAGALSVAVADAAQGASMPVPRVAEPNPWAEPAGALVLTFGTGEEGRDRLRVPVTASGVMPDGAMPDGQRTAPLPAAVRTGPVSYLGPDSTPVGGLRRWWEAVREAGREAHVVSVLKSLEPEVESIRLPATGGIRVRFSGGEQIPLAACGRSLPRLIALLLAVERAAGGILLLAEVAASLHWCMLGNMWAPILRAARELDVQIVATTQADDCLRGLDWALRTFPELAGDASLHCLRRHLIDRAIRSDAASISNIVECDIDVR